MKEEKEEDLRSPIGRVNKSPKTKIKKILWLSLSLKWLLGRRLSKITFYLFLANFFCFHCCWPLIQTHRQGTLYKEESFYFEKYCREIQGSKFKKGQVIINFIFRAFFYFFLLKSFLSILNFFCCFDCKETKFIWDKRMNVGFFLGGEGGARRILKISILKSKRKFYKN